MKKPNMKKKPVGGSGIVYLDLINTKFKDYNKEYRNDSTTCPFTYLGKMWRELDYDCNFWVFLLEHYRFHIHQNYHELREQRALNKIKRIWNRYH
jgi:hypothetical protein